MARTLFDTCMEVACLSLTGRLYTKEPLGRGLGAPVKDTEEWQMNVTSGLRERVIAAAIDDLYSHQLSLLGTKQQGLKACCDHLERFEDGSLH